MKGPPFQPRPNSTPFVKSCTSREVSSFVFLRLRLVFFNHFFVPLFARDPGPNSFPLIRRCRGPPFQSTASTTSAGPAVNSSPMRHSPFSFFSPSKPTQSCPAHLYTSGHNPASKECFFHEPDRSPGVLDFHSGVLRICAPPNLFRCLFFRLIKESAFPLTVGREFLVFSGVF